MADTMFRTPSGVVATDTDDDKVKLLAEMGSPRGLRGLFRAKKTWQVAIGTKPVGKTNNYFSVTLDDCGDTPGVVLGLVPQGASKSEMPGLKAPGVSLHLDGRLFDGSRDPARRVMRAVGKGSKIGIGLTFDAASEGGRVAQLVVTRNRRVIGAYGKEELKAVEFLRSGGSLFPAIGFSVPHTVVTTRLERTVEISIDKRKGRDSDGSIALGAWVRVKGSVTSPQYGWGSAKPGMTGMLTAKGGTAWKVDFPELAGNWYANSSELELAPAPDIAVDDVVRVKPSVKKPRYGFGGAVTHAAIGRLHSKPGEELWLVDFPQQRRKLWNASPWELERVEEPDFPVGAEVRIRADVSKPRYGWATAVKSHTCVGRVASKPSHSKYLVDFDGHTGFKADPLELVLASEPVADPGSGGGAASSPASAAAAAIAELLARGKRSGSDSGSGSGSGVDPGLAGALLAALAAAADSSDDDSKASEASESEAPPTGSHAAHEHELKRVPVRARAWLCDVCGKKGRHARCRYRCASGCDWDSCGECMVAVGKRVRVPKSLEKPSTGWGRASHASVGVVKKKNSAGNWVVDFPKHSGWVGRPRDLEVVRSPLNIGDRVQVKRSVSKPQFGWGDHVSHRSVGVLKTKKSKSEWVVCFPGHSTWSAAPSELEAATSPILQLGARVRVRPGVEPRYKWGSVARGSVGVLRKKEKRDKWIVSFPGAPSWMAFPDDLELAPGSDGKATPRAGSPAGRPRTGAGAGASGAGAGGAGAGGAGAGAMLSGLMGSRLLVQGEAGGDNGIRLRLLDGAKVRNMTLLSEDGAFGEVFRGDYIGTQVAVKILKGDMTKTKEQLDEMKREAAFLMRAQHPRVVQFMGVALFATRFPEPRLGIVTELAEQGSLRRLLEKDGQPPMDLAAKHRLARDILAGLAYLHSQSTPLLHLDLKPGNVLMYPGGRAKLADFGLACLKASAKPRGGTILYGDPRQLTGETPEPSMDIYSAALTLYRLYENKDPYHDQTILLLSPEIFLLAVNGGRRPTLSDAVPAPVQQLLKRMWHADHTKRPSALEALDMLDAIPH